MDKKVLKNIVKTRNAIRKKYKALKTGRIESESQLEETFKPITKPLKELVTKVKLEPKTEIKLEPKDEVDKSYEEMVTLLKQKMPKSEPTSTPLKQLSYSTMSEDDFATPTRSSTKRSVLDPNYYFQLCTEKDRSIDATYGVYFDGNKWKIGNSVLDIDTSGNIVINGKAYKGTMGLYELIFMKIPIRAYTEEDLNNYKSILEETNAHRRNYDKNEQVKGSKSDKYQIIKNLFYAGAHEGKGLMRIPKRDIEHVYWDDPNELVERLRLLIASQQAGHNNHNNEIISIVEELKEADIIA